MGLAEGMLILLIKGIEVLVVGSGIGLLGVTAYKGVRAWTKKPDASKPKRWQDSI